MEELNFSVPLEDRVVNVNTISFENAVFVWVGENTPCFNNLNIAFCQKFDTVPSISNLLGTNPDTFGQKLCKRLRKQVLLSFNVNVDALNKSLIEDRIIKENYNKTG